jgi:hypothetical protein
VEPARSTWSDERLDDFRRDVAERFDRVDERLNKVDRELHRLGDRLDGQTARIDALHRTLFYVGSSQTAALLGTLVALVLRGH